VPVSARGPGSRPCTGQVPALVSAAAPDAVRHTALFVAHRPASTDLPERVPALAGATAALPAARGTRCLTQPDQGPLVTTLPDPAGLAVLPGAAGRDRTAPTGRPARRRTRGVTAPDVDR